MPYKLCPGCGQTSYSAVMRGSWLCPYCGGDISAIASVYDQRLVIGIRTPASTSSIRQRYALKSLAEDKW